jgi:hypothetical protein
MEQIHGEMNFADDAGLLRRRGDVEILHILCVWRRFNFEP